MTLKYGVQASFDFATVVEDPAEIQVLNNIEKLGSTYPEFNHVLTKTLRGEDVNLTYNLEPKIKERVEAHNYCNSNYKAVLQLLSSMSVTQKRNITKKFLNKHKDEMMSTMKEREDIIVTGKNEGKCMLPALIFCARHGLYFSQLDRKVKQINREE